MIKTKRLEAAKAAFLLLLLFLLLFLGLFIRIFRIRGFRYFRFIPEDRTPDIGDNRWLLENVVILIVDVVVVVVVVVIVVVVAVVVVVVTVADVID